MQKRTKIQASSFIILFSIITVLVQFAAYYLFDASIVIWGISCLISIISCHILLEQTATYISCFNFSLLTIFISLIIIIVTYFGNVETFLPFTNTMLGIAFINWLAPMLHCFFRYMIDYGSRTNEFYDFYRNINIIFLLFYFIVMIYGNFAEGAFPWAYKTTSNTANFYPFQIISVKIENYLYGQMPLSDIVVYLTSRILIYVPYGFFIALALRHKNRIARFFSLFFLPFFIEIPQYFIIPGRCDIDDLIYALFGGLLGCFLYFLTNVIFRAVSGKDFLKGGADYRYNPLHF